MRYNDTGFHAIFSCKRSGFVRYRLLRAAINGCDVCQETWAGVGKLFNGGVIVKSGDTPDSISGSVFSLRMSVVVFVALVLVQQIVGSQKG